MAAMGVEITGEPGERAPDEVQYHAEPLRPRRRELWGTSTCSIDQTDHLGSGALHHPGAGKPCCEFRTAEHHGPRYLVQQLLQPVGLALQGDDEQVPADQLGSERPQLAPERKSNGVERHVVVPEPLRRPAVEITPPPQWQLAGAEDVGDHPVQAVPPAGPAGRLHEQQRCRQFGKLDLAVVTPRECIGQPRVDLVDDADRLKEGEEVRSLPVEYLGEEVAGDVVVVPGEGVDG